MLHQDGSMHVWLAGQPALDLIVTLDDATSAIYRRFLIKEEGTASTFRALTEVFGSHGLPMSLYNGPGRALFLHTPTAGGEVDRSETDAGRACIGASGRRAYRGLLAAGARTLKVRVFHTLQDRLVKELALKEIDRGRSGKPVPARCLYPYITPGSRSRLRRKARRLWRSRASTLRRFYASRRSVRLATIIACRSTGSSCKYRKARCAPDFVKTRLKVRQYPDGTHAILDGLRNRASWTLR